MQISTNWIITSPGRTGSRFISDVLAIYYREQFGVRAEYSGPGTEFQPNGHWQIYHTHDPTQIAIHRAHARSIVSCRDIVESALSYCVVDRTRLYHIFGNTAISEIPRVQQFHLPLSEFMEQYSYQVNFYRQIRNLIDADTVIVRYAAIQQDWRSTLWDIGIQQQHITPAIEARIQSLAPVKNHWDSRQWISNWDEIENCARNLPSNPETFFGDWNKSKTLEVTPAEGTKHE
jgi:hypothetical protein